MATYVKPGVYSRFKQSAGSVILGAGARVLAIIGESYNYKIAEETIIRDSVYPYQPNTSDALANSDVLEILSVGDRPFSSDYKEGVDFQLINDTIDWSLSGNEPNVQSKYYVRYKYKKTITDYNPQVLFTPDDAVSLFGEEKSDNPLMIAINVYFENGVAPLIAVQTEGSTIQDYKNAIDKLVQDVQGIDPTHIIVLNTDDQIHTYLLNHVETMSDMNHKKERRAIISTPVNYDDGSMKSKAEAMSSSRIIYIPQWAKRNLLSATTGEYEDFTLTGNYIASAVVGKLISRRYEESLTNVAISGFSELVKKYGEEEADLLAEKGILLLYSKGGAIKIRHDITTSTATPEENQWSIGEITDYLIKNMRDVLDKQWIGKPIYGKDSVRAVKTTVEAVLDKMIENTVITDYDSVSVTQNSTDKRRLDVKFNFAPVYPLMWIFVNFGYSK